MAAAAVAAVVVVVVVRPRMFARERSMGQIPIGIQDLRPPFAGTAAGSVIDLAYPRSCCTRSRRRITVTEVAVGIPPHPEETLHYPPQTKAVDRTSWRVGTESRYPSAAADSGIPVPESGRSAILPNQ